jgi:PPOX class probable F420-dependent enzyme
VPGGKRLTRRFEVKVEKFLRRQGTDAPSVLARSAASGATSLGALAAGAVAGGAVAIGALAIRSLAVKRARVQRLSIDELEVRRLRVQSLVVEDERSAPHPFQYLEGHKYIRLTTFRKSGEPVSTPVWFALHGGRLHITTEPDSGKMKRIRNEPRVLISPCNAWGRPKGEPVEGMARSVEDAPTGEAETVFREKYRLGLRLFHLFGQRQIGKIALEIRPVGSEDEAR